MTKGGYIILDADGKTSKLLHRNAFISTSFTVELFAQNKLAQKHVGPNFTICYQYIDVIKS